MTETTQIGALASASMRRLWKILVPVVLVVLVGGGFAVWYFLIRDTAPPRAALVEAPDDEETAADGESPDGTWEIAPSTDATPVFAGYRIQEEFGADIVKREAAGRTRAVTGTMTVEGDVVTAVDVVADVQQLQSDQNRRDSYIADNALQTNQFPEATFTLTDPIELRTRPTVGEEINTTAVGELTLHGVTREVEVEIEARWNGDTVDVAGHAPIVLADYEIEAPDTPIVSVDGNGEMEFQLRLGRT